MQLCFVLLIAFYLKLLGGPHGVAAAEAEAFVVDGVVTAVVLDICVTKYKNIYIYIYIYIYI